MYNLDYLLSTEIRKKLQRKTLNLILNLSSTDCSGRWPRCKVLINDETIFDNVVKRCTTILYNNEFADHEKLVTLSIYRYGKTSKDTKVDKNGNILENQMLQISSFMLNDIDIMKNNMIYRGKFKMNLSDNVKQYFINNNINIENHDYHFYENGIWTLQIELPVLTCIINNVKRMETFEKISYDDIMVSIAKKLEI